MKNGYTICLAINQTNPPTTFHYFISVTPWQEVMSTQEMMGNWSGNDDDDDDADPTAEQCVPDEREADSAHKSTDLV